MAVTVAVAILLFAGVAVQLACVLGVLVMGNVFDRLHFLAPTLLAVPAIAVAIILKEGASQLSVKSALTWMILLISGPVLTHATARAARVRQFGGWAVLDSEKADAQ